MNKTLKVMTSAALLAGVVAPVAVTTADAANTTVVVQKVPTVVDDYESKATGGTVASPVFTTGDAITSLVFKTDDVKVDAGERFRLELPDGVKFVKDAYSDAAKKFTSFEGVKVVYASEKTVEFEVVGGQSVLDKEFAKIPLFVEVDTTGDLKVTVNAMDSSLSSGTYTYAVAQGGSTSTTIESVKTIGEDASDIATIRIDENAVKALGDNEQTVTLKLPNNFKWNSTATIEFTGGLKGVVNQTKVLNSRTLEFTFDPTDATDRSTRGTIYISGLKVDPDRDASYGEVSVDVAGTDIDDANLVIAKYADYGVDATVENDIPEIVAGLDRDDAKEDDLKSAKITIKENIKDSIMNGKTATVVFPSWVKVIAVKDTNKKNVSISTPEYNKTRNEVEFDVTTTGKAEMDLEFILSVQADKTGDITAKFSGRAGIEGEFVVAKAIAPVSVDVKATDLEIGVKNQKLADIIIAENIKGAIKEVGDDYLTITLPDNVSFSSEPEVEVVEGNIEIGDVKLANSKDGNDDILQIKVDGESTKASKIKISGAEITLDRTVPVGAITAKIGGSFITNSTDDAVDYTGVEFEDKDYAAQFVVANVVTPAPGQSVAKEVQFNIGSTTYTVAGEEKTMDVAPFVEAGRTYMPIRYVAEAVGVTGDSIFWDQATSTATLIKGDRVVQLTSGSKSLKVNGASITMDAAAKVKDGRTVLPIRFVGQALGATVDYNEADKSVTIK